MDEINVHLTTVTRNWCCTKVYSRFQLFSSTFLCVVLTWAVHNSI